MSSNRPLINRTKICITLENGIYKRLKKYSNETSIPVTKILDKAVTMYLDSLEKK